MFDWLRKVLGTSPAPPAASSRPVRARYDAAQSNSQSEHWKMADDLGPNTANNFAVRQVLRRRSRYEQANNSYCKGVVLTVANEIVGRGPRLQMRTPDPAFNAAMEQSWGQWACAIGLADKLHVMAQSKVGDGEAQALIINNAIIPHPVQMDIRPIEAEMFTTPEVQLRPNQVDGILFDDAGNPTEYHVLRYHPGEVNYFQQPYGQFDRISPRHFLHWYRCDRPGQRRGVPEITPALNLFAQLRRWTLAVLTGAETAADIAAVLKSPDIGDGQTAADPWDHIPIKIGTLMTMPAGTEMQQFRPEQPVATYGEFKHELLKEIARCLCMPYALVAGDSSSYNFASVRFDYNLLWHRNINVTKASLIQAVLDKIFASWLAEASVAIKKFSGLTPDKCPHGWFFDPIPAVDPVKDGTGDSLALANNTDTLANICAAQGLDWREVLSQRAAEVAEMKRLGLDMYLPDFTMLMQQQIADQNGSDAVQNTPKTRQNTSKNGQKQAA